MIAKLIFFIFLISTILALHHIYPEVINMESAPHIIMTILIISFLTLTSSSNNIFKTIKSILLWLFLFIIIILGYSYKYQLKEIFYQAMANIAPGKFTIISKGKIAIKANIAEQYYISAKVNNHSVHFLIDTGASIVSIPISIAEKIGFNVSNLVFNDRFHTANGVIFCASSNNNNITLENFSVNNVNISICPNELSTPLLGVNFLKMLKKYQVENGEMVLYY